MKRKFVVLDQQLEQVINTDRGITIQRISICIEHISGPELPTTGEYVKCEEISE